MAKIKLTEWFNQRYNNDGVNAYEKEGCSDSDRILVAMLLRCPSTRWLINAAIEAEWEAFSANASIGLDDEYIKSERLLANGTIDEIRKTMESCEPNSFPSRWMGESDRTYAERVITEYYLWFYGGFRDFSVMRSNIDKICYRLDEGERGTEFLVDFFDIVDKVIDMGALEYDGFYQNFMGKNCIGEDYIVDDDRNTIIDVKELETKKTDAINALSNTLKELRKCGVYDTNFNELITSSIDILKSL